MGSGFIPDCGCQLLGTDFPQQRKATRLYDNGESSKARLSQALTRPFAVSRNFAKSAIFNARFSRRFSMGIWEAPLTLGPRFFDFSG